MPLLKTIPMLFLVAFLFSQCTGKSGKVNMKKPESVAVAFSKAMSNLNCNQASKFCTPETAKLIKAMSGFMDMIPEEKKKEAKEYAKYIKTAKCEIEGEKAKCIVCCNPEGEDSGEAVELKKDGANWLVHIDKSGL